MYLGARSRRVLAVGVLLAAGLLGGCSADPGEPARTQPGRSDSERSGAERSGAVRPEVVRPGRPGEPARVIDPGSVSVEDPWNHADVAFMQMMIPHHAQALEMSRLADKRAAATAVRSLAKRIRAAQAPEIMVIAAWLDEHGMEVPRAAEDPAAYDHSAHGHSDMAGMLSEAEMQRLADARGREFDRLFLRGMIAHHEGALAMADTVAAEGQDLRVSELAADVSAGQASEITRMENLLTSL